MKVDVKKTDENFYIYKDENQFFIILSDLHLSAGSFVDEKPNYLEEFHHDQEFCNLLSYYSQEEYDDKKVTLVINGDFLDFLAVPFVPYFDDEYWSEQSSIHKLTIILNAHQKVIHSINEFLKKKDKYFIYILGNHDAEMILPGVQKTFLSYFNDEVKKKILLEKSGELRISSSLLIQHGHSYESAHCYDPEESIIWEESTSDFNQGEDKKRYFSPPWGSYYVLRVVNRYKFEMPHFNTIRPVKYFIIHGLIFETLFTLRFILSSIFYYLMVVFISCMKDNNIHGMVNRLKMALRELILFQASEDLMLKEFEKDHFLKIIILGHTHIPDLKYLRKDCIFMNTGTWTDVHFLDLKHQSGKLMTYGLVQIDAQNEKMNSYHIHLLQWNGNSKDPFIVLS